jgi:hypothetical protein
MILKHKDDLAPQLHSLQELLAFRGLTAFQREAIEDEVRAMRAGISGEREAAYHIDFAWKDAKNSAVIHDLRIEHNGRVAQIDHLIIQRTLECHVIESKGFSREIRISELGEWETKTRFGWKGIPSPLEQNRRHIEVLKSFVADQQILPRRLGFQMQFTYHNWVLVSPGAQLRRNMPGLEQVVKMDMFDTAFTKRIDNEGVLSTLASASKLVARETVVEIANALIRAHKPASVNFAAKFGISQGALDEAKYGGTLPAVPARKYHGTASTATVAETPGVQCQSCSAALDSKVISFCRANAKRFGGRLLCQPCQRRSVPTPRVIICDACTAPIDEKVVAFCRFNSKRFAGRKLCRSCQGSHAAISARAPR